MQTSIQHDRAAAARRQRLAALGDTGLPPGPGAWGEILRGVSQGLAGEERALRNGGALASAIDTASGITVEAPPAMVTELHRLQNRHGVARRLFRSIGMNTGESILPVTDSGLTAEWLEETMPASMDGQTWSALKFTARKLTVAVPFTRALLRDSPVNLARDFLDAAARAFALQEDRAAFVGAPIGIKGFTERLNDTAMAGRLAPVGLSTVGSVDYGVLTDLMALLPEYAEPGARWFAHPTVITNVLDRVALQQGYTVSTAVGQRQFGGFPIESVSAMPRAVDVAAGQCFLLFGDPELAGIIGTRQALTVAASDEIRFAEDEVVFRATARLDIATLAGNETEAGPMVGLALTSE